MQPSLIRSSAALFDLHHVLGGQGRGGLRERTRHLASMTSRKTTGPFFSEWIQRKVKRTGGRAGPPLDWRLSDGSCGRRATYKHVIDWFFKSETSLLGSNGSIHYLSDKLPAASCRSNGLQRHDLSKNHCQCVCMCFLDISLCFIYAALAFKPCQFHVCLAVFACIVFDHVQPQCQLFHGTEPHSCQPIKMNQSRRLHQDILQKWHSKSKSKSRWGITGKQDSTSQVINATFIYCLILIAEQNRRLISKLWPLGNSSWLAAELRPVSWRLARWMSQISRSKSERFSAATMNARLSTNQNYTNPSKRISATQLQFWSARRFLTSFRHFRRPPARRSCKSDVSESADAAPAALTAGMKVNQAEC